MAVDPHSTPAADAASPTASGVAPRMQLLGLLHRTTRALHRTRQLNPLIHLCLSILVAPNGGRMQRTLLLLANHRAGSLQGMLGVEAPNFGWRLPPEAPGEADRMLAAEEQLRQYHSPFCQLVQQVRLPLDPAHNLPARAVAEGRPLGALRLPPADPLHSLLGDAPTLFLPLADAEQTFGLLVVAGSRPSPLAPSLRRFLELFASQAEIAIENCRLLQQIQTSRQDLNEAHERLIQQEKLAAIGEMAASVAHELRNPLTAVGGFAGLLTTQLEPGTKAREFADIIHREVRRLETLLVDLLAFSRKTLICVESYRIDTLLADILELELPSLLQAGIELELELAQALPPLQGDGQQIRQVLLNLIRNAVQAMSGGGRLTLKSSLSRLRGDPAVTVEVADTGGGIPQAILRNIFNPFFTTKKEGTGLGLPVCHRIVEHHRGEIEVINLEGGANFRLHLPVRLLPHTGH